MHNLSGQIAIVGVAESDRIGVVPDKSAIQLHAEAAHNALREAGLTIHDVDGILTAGASPLETAEYLGVKANFVDGTMVGVASFVMHVGHAASAIASADARQMSEDQQDAADSNALYSTFEQQIVSLFYTRDQYDIPRGWLRVMKEAIRTVAPQFSTRRGDGEGGGGVGNGRRGHGCAGARYLCSCGSGRHFRV